MTPLLLVLLVLVLPLSLMDQLHYYEYDVLVVVQDVDEMNGDEVFMAAEVAERRLREMKLPFTLSVNKLRTNCSLESPASILVRLARELTENHHDKLTVAVVGFFCKTTLQELELIGVGGEERLGLVQISVNTFLPVTGGSSRPYYYQMFPSSLAYAEALTQLMQHVGWTRHGIAFTEHQNSFYFEDSHQVIRALKDRGFGPTMKLFKVTDDIHMQRESNILRAIRSIHASGVRVLYVILPPLEAALLICRAYDYGLKWPDYAWIVLDVSLRNITSFVGNCNSNAVEGVISFRTVIVSEVKDNTLSSVNVLHKSIYASAMYNAILAAAFSLNQTFPKVQMFLARENASLRDSQLSILRAQRTVSHMIGQTMDTVFFPVNKLHSNRAGLMDGANIAIFQTVDGYENALGYYDPLLNLTRFENLTSPVVPSDQLPREYKLLSLPVRATLTACLALCLLLSLANVLLYVYYRNEPEIKASSVCLSMLIHLSCFLFVFAGANELRENIALVIPQKKMCLVRIWTVYPGADLIITTILVKVCRIYHIFNRFAKIKRVCSDKGLLVAIAFIVFVKVCILSCWTVLDQYRVVEVEIYHSGTMPPHYEVVRFCHSHYYFIWSSTVLGYTALLGAILAFVAFKARKIHRRDFKDTKKINISLSIALISVAVILPMWWVFRAEENTTAITVLPPLLYLIIVACCQLCIFSPKTIPPLCRSLTRLRNIIAHHGHRRRFTQEKIKFLKKPDPSQLSLSISNSYRTT